MILGKSLSGNRITMHADPIQPYIKKEFARENAFLREKYVLSSISECPFRKPTILDIGRSEFGPFLMLTVVQGAPADQFDDETFDEISFQVGQALRAMEDSTVCSTSFTPPSYMSIRLENLEKNINLLSNDVEIEKIKHIFAEYFNQKNNVVSDTVLNHRDLRCDNILWDVDTRTIGIIDYETACWGPRRSDLGRMLTEDFSSQRFRNALLRGYNDFHLTDIDIAAMQLLFSVEMLAYFAENPPLSEDSNERFVTEVYRTLDRSVATLTTNKS